MERTTAGRPATPLVPGLTVVDEGSPHDAIRHLLGAARAHFAMDVAFVSEFTGGRRVFRFVDGGGADPVVEVGNGDPLEDTYCQRVVDGRLPGVIPDAGANPEAMTLPVTAALPVGAHLSVPILRPDGTVFGTLCCFRSAPDATLTERDGAVLHLFAALVADHLARLPHESVGVPEAPPAAPPRDRELDRLQVVGVPAAAVLVLATVQLSIDQLLDGRGLPEALDTIAAVLALGAVAVMLAVTAVWRGIAARLLTSSAELDARVAEERAGATDLADRRGRIVDVMAARDSLAMVFQPIFDLESGAIAGHEALARFTSDRAPDVWFREAHEVGLGVELELLAVTEAIRRFDSASGYLSVNLSPAALRSPALQMFLEQSPDAHRLVLELTEHAVVDDYETIAGTIERLRQRGARLAVDDAGSGFASMRHIVDLAPDIVKLDRSLIDRIDADPARQALVESLVRFAVGIGAEVVAEGIERTEERAVCRALGVRFGQGFLLGRPAPAPRRSG